MKYFFLFLVSFLFLLPFYLMFITALKTPNDIIVNNALSLPKEGWRWYNYVKAFKDTQFLQYFWNTFVVTFFSTILGTFFCILLSFPLSMFNFKFKSAVLFLLLLSLMTTSEILVIPNYRTVANLGLVNYGRGAEVPFGDYIAMIFPYLINVVHVFLLIRTFNNVPKELYYSAKVDGASDWQYLWKILVPVVKSTIIVIMIFRIVGVWNAYAWPDLVGGKLLTNMSRKSFGPDPDIESLNIQMASAVLINIPLFLIFIFFNKYIVSGDNQSGIKG
ncbi:carbohydrate ABC transporter permease ['Camptotheca acuminata' phytoplasma]|uniref:carbohydrate ABC transporter permease n=1 Tax='Camptotheca acuminata' phytoplasma TaxID=3239192 RepID=UPI00351A9AA8